VSGFQTDNVTLFNLWGSFTATDALWFAAEFSYKDGGDFNTGYNWLGFANLTTSDTLSWTFRVSGESMDDVGAIDGAGFLRGTVSPTYTVNDNFVILAEATYTDYNSASGLDSETFLGLNAIFSW
jgi:hypothetical protein